MDYSVGGAGGSGDEDNSNSQKGKRSFHKRFTASQTDILEKFFRECPRPNEAQRRQFAEEVGLEPKQIKFWFQNKRNQMKNQHERANNTALRIENEKIQNENILIKEALENINCLTCGGPPFPEEEHELYMQKMQQENRRLKEEQEKVFNLLVRYSEKQMSQRELNQALAYIESLLNQGIDGSSSYVHSHGTPTMGDGMSLAHNPMENPSEEKSVMYKIATIAMEELVKLVRINEPFWVNSSTTQDGKLTLHRQSYEQIFPKTNHFNGANAHEESSKCSSVVNLSGMHLVDMFLDSGKWTNLFPAIVTKAETIKVFETGLLGNRDGALQLMYEEMHILSPLVRPREFNFIRYCKQVDVGVWVITDVSFDYPQPNVIPLSRSWKHPSGCMIREMPNGSCMVTWVEHVKVDDKIHSHFFFKDLVGAYNLYGAENWIRELQRMCERFASFFVEKIPDRESGGVIKSLKGRKSVMKLAHRMLMMFCESLTMPGQLDNNGAIRVSIRKTTGVGEPNGIVVCASTTISLSLPFENVFEFLTDHKKRAQWDVLSYENPVQEIAHISNGHYPGNCTSILQTSIPCENQAMILQESFLSPMGSYVIYAPVDVATMNVVIRGEEPTVIPILPSGFVVCPDGQPNATLEDSKGSLLTLAYQILACSPDRTELLNMEFVSVVNSLLASTVQKVKDALKCNSSE